MFGDKLNQKTHLPKEKSNLIFENSPDSQNKEKVRPDDGIDKVDPYREPIDEINN